MNDQAPRESTRSAHRRLAVVRAAANLLRRRGIDTLTHRAVAEEAALPPQTVRAYLATREELRCAALQYTLDGWVRRAEEFIERLPEPLTLNQTARAIVEVATVHPVELAETTRATIAGVYERYIQSGRHPELRPLITDYNRQLVGLVARVLSRYGRRVEPRIAQAMLAVVDGTVIYQLAAGEAPTPAAINALELAIPLLCPTSERHLEVT